MHAAIALEPNNILSVLAAGSSLFARLDRIYAAWGLNFECQK